MDSTQNDEVCQECNGDGHVDIFYHGDWHDSKCHCQYREPDDMSGASEGDR